MGLDHLSVGPGKAIPYKYVPCPKRQGYMGIDKYGLLYQLLSRQNNLSHIFNPL